jgi:glycosyltransferase involved in cell wall biosynthesis
MSRTNKLFWIAKYFLQGIPIEYRYLKSEGFARKLHNLTEEIDFDIVHILPSPMGIYLDYLQLRPSCRKILGFFDANSSRFSRISKIQSNPYRKIRNRLFSIMVDRWESKTAQRFDSLEVVSELDRKMLHHLNPRIRIDVIPNGVDTNLYQPLPRQVETPTLLFIGKMDYFPCTDAVLFFSKEIFPLVQRGLPRTKLLIVGDNPPPEILQLESESTHVTGRVKDILPYYQRSSVCVVPLRAAGGTRLKILEAMALGRPVVSTSIGCEGLDIINEEHLLVADTPERFSEQIIRLLTDHDLYCGISANARQLVLSRYDWDSIANRMSSVYAELVNK